MTISRRARILAAGLYALLLIASPALAWKKSYNCLSSGAIGLGACCQEEVHKPGGCAPTSPEPEVQSAARACDCCVLVLTRQVPSEAQQCQPGPASGPPLTCWSSAPAVFRPRSPYSESPRLRDHPTSRAGPSRRLLHSSFLF